MIPHVSSAPGSTCQKATVKPIQTYVIGSHGSVGSHTVYHPARTTECEHKSLDHAEALALFYIDCSTRDRH
jgi:hypothetical protein